MIMMRMMIMISRRQGGPVFPVFLAEPGADGAEAPACGCFYPAYEYDNIYVYGLWLYSHSS